MTNLGNLFKTTNGANSNISGANQLQKTAQLTNVSTDIAHKLLKTFDADSEQYQAKVVASLDNHDQMDKLINEAYDLKSVDIAFLTEEKPDVIDKMIRSQQSKRSRSKGKVMTMENYTTMLIGAVAENLLRMASDKPKSAAGGNYKLSDIGYSEEQLQTLAADQEALKKEIRNVQSKKSIAKSKADFDPNSTRWTQLLVAEEALKSLRAGAQPVDPELSIKAEKIDQMKEVLAGVENLEQLKGADAKSILKSISDMLSL